VSLSFLRSCFHLFVKQAS